MNLSLAQSLKMSLVGDSYSKTSRMIVYSARVSVKCAVSSGHFRSPKIPTPKSNALCKFQDFVKSASSGATKA